MRGKARVICEETGVGFSINTLFPFTGQIFAHDKKRIPMLVHQTHFLKICESSLNFSCMHHFNQAWNVNVSFSYAECGVPNTQSIAEGQPQTQHHLQIIVMFAQPNGKTSTQSFTIQCGQQRIAYQKQVIPKRIEEALEVGLIIALGLPHSLLAHVRSSASSQALWNRRRQFRKLK